MREYQAVPALAAMQRLAQRIWSRSTGNHIGDLAWGATLHEVAQREGRTAVWSDPDGTVRAWGWMRSGRLDQLIDPATPHLAAQVLDWYEQRGTDQPRTVAVLDAERHVLAEVERRGYRGEPFLRYTARDLADLPPVPALPPGYTARPVGPADLERRVEVHRAAFAPSRVTAGSYRTVMATWPYRSDLDWVVQAPDGQFAAFCLIWLDQVHGVGELEPVGCHPGYRRRGLTRAVCLSALHALKAAGGTSALVMPLDGAGHDGAGPLYESLGFRGYARGLLYRRAAGTDAAAGTDDAAAGAAAAGAAAAGTTAAGASATGTPGTAAGPAQP
jgi:ribosomal protein S18 acetylase RimI-like enzyme